MTTTEIRYAPVFHRFIGTADQARNVVANHLRQGTLAGGGGKLVGELSDGRVEIEIAIWTPTDQIPTVPPFHVRRRRELYATAVAAVGTLFACAALMLLAGAVVETLTTSRGLVVGTLAILGGVFLTMSLGTARNGE